jgi:hypothetical protein
LQAKYYEKEGTKVSTEGVNKEKKQDERDKQGLQWGAGARIRQRKAAEGGIKDTEESDSDEELERFRPIQP